MTTLFRVVLVVVSVFTMAFILRKIRQAKVQIEAALFWVLISVVLVVFAVCPPVADACARLLGIYSTANFLFLLMIFILLIKVFSLTLQVSQLESKQRELVQKMALDQLERETREAGEKHGAGAGFCLAGEGESGFCSAGAGSRAGMEAGSEQTGAENEDGSKQTGAWSEGGR